MKFLAYIFRPLCQLLGFGAIFYVIDYAYQNPSDLLGMYIRLPLIFLSMNMFPPRAYNRRIKEVFMDNLEAFEGCGHHWEQIFKQDRSIGYHSRKATASDNSAEHRFASSLLNYVVEKDYTDDEPYIQIQRKLWSNGIKVTIHCTWYRKFKFYWIPDNEKFRFEHLRFDAVIELADNWFITV